MVVSREAIGIATRWAQLMRWELAVKHLKLLYLLFFWKMVTPTPGEPG